MIEGANSTANIPSLRPVRSIERRRAETGKGKMKRFGLIGTHKKVERKRRRVVPQHVVKYPRIR